ncbi:MAG: hypothetical protein IPO12_05895 [Flavobacteriales bacterium]|nr:hypothetical protein [Flavobacteriales bacterium]
MPEAEALVFDADMQRDAALKARYDLFALSVRGIRSSSQGPEAVTLRERMRVIDEELDARPTVVRSIFRPWMGWAAAAAVLVSTFGAWWFTKEDTPQQLAEEFAIVEPGLPVLMGTSPRTMDAIMNAYKQEDFGTARRLLAVAVEQDPQNDTLQYFNGVLDQRVDRCDSGERWFSQVPATSVFAAKARYNLALCALKSGDVSRARELLGRIAELKDAQVSAKARDLLLRLENM